MSVIVTFVFDIVLIYCLISFINVLLVKIFVIYRANVT